MAEHSCLVPMRYLSLFSNYWQLGSQNWQGASSTKEDCILICFIGLGTYATPNVTKYQRSNFIIQILQFTVKITVISTILHHWQGASSTKEDCILICFIGLGTYATPNVTKYQRSNFIIQILQFTVKITAISTILLLEYITFLECNLFFRVFPFMSFALV